MSDFKRRDFLKTAAGVAAGTALGHRLDLVPAEAAAQTYKAAPGEGRETARAALETLRAGRRRRVGGQHQEIYGRDRHRSARRRRRLGGRAAQGGGGGQRRQRAGHHHQHHGRRAPVSGEAGRRQRSRQLPGQQVRRLVRRGEGVRHARQEVGGDHDGRRRRHAGLPREPAQGRGLRHGPEGHGRFPQAVPGAEGQGHAGRLRTGQCHR